MLVDASNWKLIEIAYIISKLLCHSVRGLEVYLLVWLIQQLLSVIMDQDSLHLYANAILGTTWRHLIFMWVTGVQFKMTIFRGKEVVSSLYSFLWWKKLFRRPPAYFSLSFIVKDQITWSFLNQWLERDLHDWLSHMGMEEILEAQSPWPFMTVSKIVWVGYFLIIKLKGSVCLTNDFFFYHRDGLANRKYFKIHS